MADEGFCFPVRFCQLGPEQQRAVLNEGPNPDDQGAVRDFLTYFNARFGTSVSPEAMRGILAKAAKKNRNGNGRCQKPKMVLAGHPRSKEPVKKTPRYRRAPARRPPRNRF